jgi:hypothetical protein
VAPNEALHPTRKATICNSNLQPPSSQASNLPPKKNYTPLSTAVPIPCVLGRGLALWSQSTLQAQNTSTADPRCYFPFLWANRQTWRGATDRCFHTSAFHVANTFLHPHSHDHGIVTGEANATDQQLVPNGTHKHSHDAQPSATLRDMTPRATPTVSVRNLPQTLCPSCTAAHVPFTPPMQAPVPRGAHGSKGCAWFTNEDIYEQCPWKTWPKPGRHRLQEIFLLQHTTKIPLYYCTISTCRTTDHPQLAQLQNGHAMLPKFQPQWLHYCRTAQHHAPAPVFEPGSQHFFEPDFL